MRSFSHTHMHTYLQATFDDISQANVTVSYPELLKFASVMFYKTPFPRSEISWVMSKAKTDPYGKAEGNWHGDTNGDLKSVCMHVYVCECMHVCVCVYIYIYRENRSLRQV
jgi:hypothetical protein